MENTERLADVHVPDRLSYEKERTGCTVGLTDTLTQGYSMADIISGTDMRAAILDELRQEVEAIREKHGTVPGLVTILVGENPASISYVTLKVKTALSLGFHEIQDNQPADAAKRRFSR